MSPTPGLPLSFSRRDRGGGAYALLIGLKRSPPEITPVFIFSSGRDRGWPSGSDSSRFFFSTLSSASKFSSFLSSSSSLCPPMMVGSDAFFLNILEKVPGIFEKMEKNEALIPIVKSNSISIETVINIERIENEA